MTPLLVLAVKGTLVLALAAAASFALRRAPAAVRHGVWVASFGAVVLLPVLDSFGPHWDIGVLPPDESTEVGGVVAFAGPSASVVVSTEQEVRGFEGEVAAFEGEMAVLEDQMQALEAELSAFGDGHVALSVSHAKPGRSWASWLAGAWGLGALVVGLGWLAALAAAQRVVATARPETDEDWGVLAERARRLIGLDAPVRLLRSDALDVPIAWGWGRPAVVLPAGADEWDDDRREAVLLHEMAHLRRRDAWSGLVAQVAVALHWPNPLAWWGYRRFLAAREQACDDAVLAGGARPSAYAAHLVGVARALRRDRLALVGAAPMARPGSLEDRVVSILDAGRRRGRLSRPGLGATLLFTAFVALPIAALQPVAQTAPLTTTVPSATPTPPVPPTPPAPPTPHSAPTVTVAPPAPPPVPADTTDEETEEVPDEVERAMREARVEMDRAREEVRQALREMETVNPTVDRIHADALRAAESALAQVDMVEIQREAEQAAREAMRDAREHQRSMRDHQREIEREARERRRELHEAARSLREAEHDLRRDAERARSRAERDAAHRDAETLRRARERLDRERKEDPARAPRPQARASESFDWDAVERARADAIARNACA